MDKAEIRAKAERLKVLLDSRLDGTIEMSALNEVIESVLTAAYDAGWNEAVEAAAKKSYFPEAAGGVAGAIRRLRIDIGVAECTIQR